MFEMGEIHASPALPSTPPYPLLLKGRGGAMRVRTQFHVFDIDNFLSIRGHQAPVRQLAGVTARMPHPFLFLLSPRKTGTLSQTGCLAGRQPSHAVEAGGGARRASGSGG